MCWRYVHVIQLKIDFQLSPTLFEANELQPNTETDLKRYTAINSFSDSYEQKNSTREFINISSTRNNSWSMYYMNFLLPLRETKQKKNPY